MDLKLFLENGALVTLSGHRTIFCQGLKATVAAQSECFVAPQFSLRHLSTRFHGGAIHHKFPGSIAPREKSPLRILDLNWTADLEAYKNSYLKVQCYIQKGELRKAVPFMNYKASKPEGFNQKILPKIIERLIQIQHSQEYLYGMWNEDSGFIGSTPEVLIQKKPQSSFLNTMALAGTLPLTNSKNMLEDSKLVDEHRIVMDDIAKKLHDHKVMWSQPQEKAYGILKHLYAEAHFESDQDLTELIERLSPTSALGVFPSENWRQYDDILQLQSRGSYGAPFGFINDEEIMILVCLRGLFWDEDNVYIRVGGGVTVQSLFETEVKELELKFLSTKTKLGL